MKGEILFRAFYKGDIEKGKPLMFVQKEIDNELFFVMKEDEEFRYKFFIPFIDNDWILQQWTGLYDNTKWEQLTEKEQKAFLIKHKKAEWIGKMIFEGDVVRLKIEDDRDYETDGYVEAEVCWIIEKEYDNPAYCGFGLKVLESDKWFKKGETFLRQEDLNFDNSLFETEIIGNIHDNKELLGEQNGNRC